MVGRLPGASTACSGTVTSLEGQIRDLAEQAAQQRDLALVIGQVETFAATVRQQLDTLDWEAQRTLIRTLVKRVEIDREEVHVVFRINPATLPPPANDPSSHYCWGREYPTYLQHSRHSWDYAGPISTGLRDD